MNLSILIRAILGLAFFQGVFSYLGIPEMQYRLLLELLIVLLFSIFFYFLLQKKDKSIRAPGLTWFIVFTIAVFASALINESSLSTSIRFYRQILWPYLFFLSILNINLSPQSINKITRFIVFLVILQIPAAVFKYLMFGVVEGILIGTFATRAGSMSTIFPLFVIGFIFSFYFIYKRNPLYLLLIPGLMFFAWGGGKRAFFIFLPLLLLIAYFAYIKVFSKNNLSYVKIFFSVITVLVIASAIVYVGARAQPRFNPDREMWGSFDIAFVYGQIVTHETRFRQGLADGRMISTQILIDEIIFSGNIKRSLFGDGPDRMYLPDSAIEDYGIIYGITGFNFMLISVGITGVISLFLLYFTLGIKGFKMIKKLQDPFYKALSMGILLATIVFCFDYFFYSREFFTDYIPSIVLFYFLAIVLKQQSDKKINESIIHQQGAKTF